MTRQLWLMMLIGCTDKAPGDSGSSEEVATDADADGYDTASDCDDTDAAVSPGADEVCDGVDNNCDGAVDEGVTATYYADSDGDGYGDPAVATAACDAPAGTVGSGDDCDDADASAWPGAEEVCDGVDNDCDDAIDEDVTTTFYADMDGDGYGDAGDTVEGCAAPSDYISDGTDCDDTDSGAHPGGAEVCDGVDNDCDAKTAEDGLVTWSSGGVALDMTTDFDSGTPGSPSAITLSSAGTLSLCGGMWHATVALTDDVDIIGIGGSTSNTIDGGGAGSVVSLRADKRDASIAGLTLQNGTGDGSDPIGFGGGGGVDCLGFASELSLTDVIIQDNTAGVGGGIAVQGCILEADGVTISGNTASYGGGGVAIFSGTVTFEDSLIIDNEATTLGGGVHVQGYRFAWAYLDLNETLVTKNYASYGSGMSQYNTSEVTCTGSTKGAYGFTRNGRASASPYSAAIFMTTLTTADTFTATDCDFGTGSDENPAGDVYHAYDRTTYSKFGYDASFVCDDESCY